MLTVNKYGDIEIEVVSVYRYIFSRDRTVDGVWICNWIYCTCTLVPTNKYDCLSELHTPKITVTTANINRSKSLLAVA
jgi:hypothetical protein